MSNSCIPAGATELTDALFNCCTNVLTIIQTGADGVETKVTADLSCIRDYYKEVIGAEIDCETGVLSLELKANDECAESTFVTVDLTCIDTYVTWTDNGNGSVTLISNDEQSTIGVMRDCAGIDIEYPVNEQNLLVMCTPDGDTVKAPIEDVTDAIGIYSVCELPLADVPDVPENAIVEFAVCIDGNQYRIPIEILIEHVPGFATVLEDGTGTDLSGTGAPDDPYVVDLDVCELPTEVYDPNAVITGCIGGQTKNMPAIKAGDNVQINIDGTLNVHTEIPSCDLPQINYDQNGRLVTCSNGVSVTTPAINAGTNVTIDQNGRLDVSIPASANQRLSAILLKSHDIPGTGNRFPSTIIVKHQVDPGNSISVWGGWLRFNRAGLVLATAQGATRSDSGVWVKPRIELSVAGNSMGPSEYPNMEWISDSAAANIGLATTYVVVNAGDRMRFGGWTYQSAICACGEATVAFIEA